MRKIPPAIRPTLSPHALFSLLIVTTAVIALPASAQEPDPTDASSTSETDPKSTPIPILVEQLNAPSRATRESAEQTLKNMDAAALRELPTSSPIPSVNAALARIRNSIQQSALQSRLTQPTRISLQSKTNLGELFIHAPQLHDLINVTESQQALPIHIAQSEMPFWDAITALTNQTNLWPADPDSRGRITFRDAPAESTSIAISNQGAFRSEAEPLRIKPIPNNDTQHLLRLPLTIRSEPAVRPLFISCAAKNTSLSNANNQRLSPFTPMANWEVSVGKSGGTANFQLDFVGSKQHIPTTFDGQFEITLAGAEQNFIFPLDPRRPLPQVREERHMRVELQDFEQSGQNLSITLRVIYEQSGTAFESYRTWIYHNNTTLQFQTASDETQNRPPEPAFDTIAHAPGVLELRYQFKNVPPNANQLNLTYNAPISILTLPLDIHIPNLKQQPIQQTTTLPP